MTTLRVLGSLSPSGGKDPTRSDSEDWRWQMQNAVTRTEALQQHLALSSDELEGARRAERDGFPISITPHYLSLIDRDDVNCPIRRQVVPRIQESQLSAGDLIDPLGEEQHEVAPDLIQRYPDRALLLVSDRCAVYCRFCTRSRMVGDGGGPRSRDRLQPALDYLTAHPAIRDVIISGGDPLVMATERLRSIVAAVRDIPSVETIRIGTRVPVVIPQRITSELLEALRPYHPLWIMTHFNHPKELSERARKACRDLVDAGFPVMNQTVLLKGVNDNPQVLEELFRGLVRERVRPYYLLQADPVKGTGHLRTPLQRGVEILRALQGRVSGIALPKLVVDTPGGFGKVPMVPNYVVSAAGGTTRFLTPRGVEVDYLDPPED